MGREDDMAEMSRHSSSRGNRGDARTPVASTHLPPTSGGLRYDPTMVASSYGNDSYPVYQQQSYMPEESAHVPGSSNKRKRVKKERGNDDWIPAPPPPPPPPPPRHEMGDGGASMHMMPTILHRANTAVPSATATAASSAPPPFVRAYPSTNSSISHTTTIFNEAPMEIRSFAETERRRQAAAASVAPPGGALSHLVHAVEETGAVIAPAAATKPTTNGAALSWSSRGGSGSGSGSGTMSVFDVFFPAHTQRNPPPSQNSSSRESKRRRRNQNREPSHQNNTSGSTRASRRNGAPALASPDSPTLDMMRFAVDSFKLIPQGLVDRIDHRLRPDLVASLIARHVENWIKRASFDDRNFLQEITTLVNAYYPCTYSTILDEVLVAFLFRRPELMERLLTVVIERLQKAGESASPAKYPVITSFTRRCGLSSETQRDQARHDLACLTVLRLLLERNTEKYMLSPWIASCASFCSDEVLSVLWETLLQPLVPSSASKSQESKDPWNIHDPLSQIFELLREERQTTRHVSESAIPRLSMTLIQKIVRDPAFAELKRVPVTCEAFEIFFGHPVSHTTRFTDDWVAYKVANGGSHEDVVAKVIQLTVDNCVRLSVKKSNWFIRHVLGLAVAHGEAPFTRILEQIFVDHIGLVLGGVAKSEILELQPSSESTQQPPQINGNVQSQASSVVVVVGKISPNEKQIEAGVVAQLGLLLESLRALPQHRGAAVIAVWSNQWCQPRIRTPWSYVWGVVSCALHGRAETSALPSKVDHALLVFAAQLAKHYTAWLLEQDRASQHLTRISRIVNASIKSAPSSLEAATRLLSSVVDAVATLPRDATLSQRVYSLIAAALADELAVRETRQKESKNASPSGVDAFASRQPRRRLAVLHVLYKLSSEKDAVGRVVRDEVLVRRRTNSMMVEIVRHGEDADVEMALKILSTIVGFHDGQESQSLWTASMVQSVVAFAYRVRVPVARRNAVAFLHSISSRFDDSTCATMLLWTVLRACTSHCCGCGLNGSGASPTRLGVAAGDDPLQLASLFADLVKFVLQRSSDDVVGHVVVFIQQRIVSCGRGEWNLFLAYVLDRVVQLGWSRLVAFVSSHVAQLALSPFESTVVGAGVSVGNGKAARQLRVLKSLCLALMDVKSPVTMNVTAWEPTARLLASDQLRVTLTHIATQNACATSAALARSIAMLCDEIKRILETR